MIGYMPDKDINLMIILLHRNKVIFPGKKRNPGIHNPYRMLPGLDSI
jgi:hypothetical protein